MATWQMQTLMFDTLIVQGLQGILAQIDHKIAVTVEVNFFEDRIVGHHFSRGTASVIHD